MKCTNCGTENTAGSRFCCGCGSKLEKLCPKCQQPVAENARFCSFCGEPLASEAPASVVMKDNVIAGDVNMSVNTTINNISDQSISASMVNVYQGAQDLHADFEFETQIRNGKTVSVLRKITNIRNTTVTIPEKDRQGNPVVEIATKEPFGANDYRWGVCDRSVEHCIIPNSVISIGQGAFHRCQRLTEINIPSSVTSIGERAFSDSGLQNITIPHTVTTIGKSAFCSCKFTSITIPDSVTYIGDGAFTNCKFITSIAIPDSVTYIGNSLISGCLELTHVSLPKGLTRISDRMFSYCNSFKSIVIPDGITSIGEGAFAFCDNLIQVTIPASVTSIGYSAFDRSDKLAQIIFLGTRAEWNAICSKDTTHHLRYIEKDKVAVYCAEDIERARRKAEEQRKIDALRASRRAQNLCQYCGGPIKTGWFSTQCKVCGKLKDY